MQSTLQKYITQTQARKDKNIALVYTLLDPALTDNNEEIFLGPSLVQHVEFHKAFRFIQSWNERDLIRRLVDPESSHDNNTFGPKCCSYCGISWSWVASEQEIRQEKCRNNEHVYAGVSARCYFCYAENLSERYRKLSQYAKYNCPSNMTRDEKICAHNGHMISTLTHTCVVCMKTTQEIQIEAFNRRYGPIISNVF